jgi:hypothetical protein
MLYQHKPDGQTLTKLPDSGVIINGQNIFPALLDQRPDVVSELVAAGLLWTTTDPVAPNPLYYTYTVNADGTYTSAPIPLSQVQAQQTAAISAACQAAILAGFAAKVGASTYNICYGAQDQSNLQTNATTVLAKMSSAKPWSAAMTVNQFDVIQVNGEYYIAMTGGTAGTTQPTLPTQFQQEVTDGTIQWALFGLLVATYTTTNGVTTYTNVWFDAASIYSIFAQGVNWLTGCRAKYNALAAQIAAYQPVIPANNETDIANILAIVWSYP